VSDSAASLRWFFKVDVDQVEEILFFEIASSSRYASGSVSGTPGSSPWWFVLSNYACSCLSIPKSHHEE